MKTKIAILGVGRWGVHFVRNFLDHPQAQVVAVVDASSQRLAACQEKFNLNTHQVILATDWQIIRQIEGLDAIVVATPASTHYPLILDALNCGYHVLSEKPLTLDPKECLELTQLAQQKQLVLLVDHIYLFHEAVKKGREVMQSNPLGQLRYGYASRTHLGPVRQDVDALWDLAIHDIAIFNDWLGQTPIQVQARGTVWLQPNTADLVWLTLTYPDGFQAYIHLCWSNTDKQRRLTVVGTQGSLTFDELSLDAPLTLQRGYFEQQGELFIPTGQSSEIIAVEKAEPLKTVCNYFLQAIDKKTLLPISSGGIATELVQILSCLSLSLQRDGEIVLNRNHFYY